MTCGFSGLIYARDTTSPRTSMGARLIRGQGTLARRWVGWRGKETGSGNIADAREVMNIRQASNYLGVSPDTLYKYVGEQKIPAFKLGNRWRFKKSRLDQWMEEKSSQMEAGTKHKAKVATKAAAGSL